MNKVDQMKKEQKKPIFEAVPSFLTLYENGSGAEKRWAMKAVIASCILCAKEYGHELYGILPVRDEWQCLRVAIERIIGIDHPQNQIIEDVVTDILKEIEEAFQPLES